MPEPLREDTAAVSEVVGALLLVVIVSTAAFSFGLFVNQQQKKTQEQQALEDDRRLEKLAVLAIRSTASGAAWEELEFDLVSLHAKSTVVTGIRINDTLVKNLQVDGIDFSFDSADPNRLEVAAREQAVLRLEGLSTSAGRAAAFFSPSGPIPQTATLEIEVLTERGNQFREAFTPPEPVLKIEQQNLGDTVAYILDGTGSVPDRDGFIVDFEWEAFTVSAGSCDTLTPYPGFTALHGPRAQFTGLGGGDYCFRLTVTDGFGLEGARSLVVHLNA